MDIEMVVLYKGSRSMEVPVSDKQRWIDRGWQTEPPEEVCVADED